jgi:hypothetical protein
MKVIRKLALYNRLEEKYIKSFEVKLPLDDLIELLCINIEIDPNVYMFYEVGYEQYVKFSVSIPELVDFKFEDCSIYYECFQGPDWSEE